MGQLKNQRFVLESKLPVSRRLHIKTGYLGPLNAGRDLRGWAFVDLTARPEWTLSNAFSGSSCGLLGADDGVRLFAPRDPGHWILPSFPICAVLLFMGGSAHS